MGGIAKKKRERRRVEAVILQECPDGQVVAAANVVTAFYGGEAREATGTTLDIGIVTIDDVTVK